ncbi:MAG: hypothetical protein M3296_02210 [Actinomycetota bacterium]|nr:hypothetical protein [Actinomycetota bacterium]
MEIDAIQTAVERIEEGVREARAALEVLREGDVSAMQDLDEVVDALAREIADLKSHTANRL